MFWKKKPKPLIASVPREYIDVLRRCNFYLARREFADFLRTSNEDARVRGGEVLYREEFADGWKRFSENPCHETAIAFIGAAPDWAPIILKFFAGCCPGGIYYRPAIRTAQNFEVGNYTLGKELRYLKLLGELSEAEYRVFGRESSREVLYHAASTEFVGRQWEVMVGAIDDKLYQVAASREPKNEKETTQLAEHVYKHCETLLGTPTEEGQGLFTWDTLSGSVVFQYAYLAEASSFAANLFVGTGTRHQQGKRFRKFK